MKRLVPVLGLALLILLPWLPLGPARLYILHVSILILVWAVIGTAWSLMGRFGLVSLGHGAFLGVGAYTSTLLWNFWGISPWIGAPLAVMAAVLLALVLGYPCFRTRVVGHYFALVTLALGEVIRLLIIAEREWTGGSLGLTLEDAGAFNLGAVQFTDKRIFYFIALGVWLVGLGLWWRVDRSMTRSALEAIGEDETAAASVGIPVTRFKLKITLLSAALTAVGGVLYAQYMTYLNPGTLAGIGVSLQIVFAAVLGGRDTLLGPSVGTALTIALAEYLRVAFGVKFLGMAETIYGLALILIIIFLPAGLYGGLKEFVLRPPRATPARARASAG